MTEKQEKSAVQKAIRQLDNLVLCIEKLGCNVESVANALAEAFKEED